MTSVFWDSEGVLLVDIMQPGTTINSNAYVQTLKKLQGQLRCVRPHRQREDVFLLHDNACPHVSRQTIDVIQKLGWTVLPHPPYSPDLAPSDYHLFGKLKDELRGTRFDNNEDLVTAVKQWFKRARSEFYPTGIHDLAPRWCKAIEMDGDYVEK